MCRDRQAPEQNRIGARKAGRSMGTAAQIDGQLESRVAELEKRAGKARSCGGAHGSTGCWGLGMAIAVVLSWSRNASILWCILHGIFSWGYVIYFAATRK